MALQQYTTRGRSAHTIFTDSNYVDYVLCLFHSCCQNLILLKPSRLELHRGFILTLGEVNWTITCMVPPPPPTFCLFFSPSLHNQAAKSVLCSLSPQVYSFLDRGLSFLLLSNHPMLVSSQRLGHCKQVLCSTEADPSLSLLREWPSRRTLMYRRENSSRFVIASLLCLRDEGVCLIMHTYYTGIVESSCGRGCSSEDCE